MTIEQTIEIPESRKLHLELSLPETLTPGTASVVVTINPFTENTMAKPKTLSDWRSFRGCLKSDGHEVDRFIERHIAERKFEDKIDERQKQESKQFKEK